MSENVTLATHDPVHYPRINMMISDLFFNYQNESYNALYSKQSDYLEIPTQEEIYQAIRKDAEEFYSNYSEILDRYGVSAGSLAADFMNRI